MNIVVKKALLAVLVMIGMSQVFCIKAGAEMQRYRQQPGSRNKKTKAVSASASQADAYSDLANIERQVALLADIVNLLEQRSIPQELGGSDLSTAKQLNQLMNKLTTEDDLKGDIKTSCQTSLKRNSKQVDRQKAYETVLAIYTKIKKQLKAMKQLQTAVQTIQQNPQDQGAVNKAKVEIAQAIDAQEMALMEEEQLGWFGKTKKYVGSYFNSEWLTAKNVATAAIGAAVVGTGYYWGLPAAQAAYGAYAANKPMREAASEAFQKAFGESYVRKGAGLVGQGAAMAYQAAGSLGSYAGAQIGYGLTAAASMAFNAIIAAGVSKGLAYGWLKTNQALGQLSSVMSDPKISAEDLKIAQQQFLQLSEQQKMNEAEMLKQNPKAVEIARQALLDAQKNIK